MDDINIKEQKFVSSIEPEKDKNKIVLNFGNSDEKAPDPSELPNANSVLDDVILILECMATDEMKNLKNTNINVFEQVMEDRFQDFSFKYYSIFRMILSGEDITPLFMMLDAINDVNSGKKNFEEALLGADYYEYFIDMFAFDFGHCSRKGNRLIAQNVAEIILKNMPGNSS